MEQPNPSMNRLIQTIEQLRAKLDGLRKHSLKETPTRTIVIDPILEALGWDVRDPDEVQLEYPTVDGKSVDYALKINRKATLLVEAKALDDPLDDVKAITQVVGYASNDGIVWCVLTNGIRWRVYRSVEKCPAPEKLMYEVSIDPRDSEGMTTEQVAGQLWRLSRNEMAKGTLDEIGEQTFTDSKVRKALDGIMRDAPRQLLNLVRAATGDSSIAPQKIKESLARIWSIAPLINEPQKIQITTTARVAASVRKSTGADGKKRETPEYSERHHTEGKPKEVLELYQTLDRLCLSLKPGEVEKRHLKLYVAYRFAKHIFCSVHLQQGGLRVWLKLKYSQLEKSPAFVRDVTGVGHWGVGDLELGINSASALEEAIPLIRKAFAEASL